MSKHIIGVMSTNINTCNLILAVGSSSIEKLFFFFYIFILTQSDLITFIFLQYNKHCKTQPFFSTIAQVDYRETRLKNTFRLIYTLQSIYCIDGE